VKEPDGRHPLARATNAPKHDHLTRDVDADAAKLMMVRSHPAATAPTGRLPPVSRPSRSAPWREMAAWRHAAQEFAAEDHLIAEYANTSRLAAACKLNRHE